MRIKIITHVGAKKEQVKLGFTKDLFLSLNPPFPPVKLLRFDGCKTADRVVLELNFILFKQEWVSVITEDKEDTDSWYFVDVGTKLPFFLKHWQHHHGVKSSPKGAMIIDDITFSTGNGITDLILYPLLYGQFLYRKPIYKNTFKK